MKTVPLRNGRRGLWAPFWPWFCLSDQSFLVIQQAGAALCFVCIKWYTDSKIWMRVCASYLKRWDDKKREDHRIMPENGTQRAVTQPDSFLCYNQPVSLCLCSSSSLDWVWGLDPQRLISTFLLATLPPHKILLMVQSSKSHYTVHRESWCWEMGCSEPDKRCEGVQRLSKLGSRKQDRHISSVLCPP